MFRVALRKLFLSKTVPKNFLLFYYGGIGDTLMLTPAIRALKEKYPSAKVDFVLGHKYVEDTFWGHPRINKIYRFDNSWTCYKPFFNIRSKIEGFFKIIFYQPILFIAFSFKAYDIGINFSTVTPSANLGNALMWCLLIPRRIGFNSCLNYLTEAQFVDTKKLHRVDVFFSFLKPLKIYSTNYEYEFFVKKESIIKAKQIVEEGFSPELKGPIVAVHPGGKIHTISRRWPKEYFAKVIKFLITQYQARIIITGGKDDISVCEEIASSVEGKHILNLCGKVNIQEVFALVSLCKVCITSDTSLLHIAEAVKIPHIISLFGPTDSKLLVPRSKRHIVISSNLACSPCAGSILDSETQQCFKAIKQECLLSIKPERVNETIKQIFNKQER